ncbi:Uncharacterised protein [Serratia odorifera]|uniref:Uncharacterized protein n=1 Tax=Serratia odorifera TaxID=618 RepID=A0A3S4HHB4_SEROD|nr:Uncharacterised protein [Serratia odorifera]
MKGQKDIGKSEGVNLSQRPLVLSQKLVVQCRFSSEVVKSVANFNTVLSYDGIESTKLYGAIVDA